MDLYNIASAAIGHLVGRLLRRALLALLVAIFAFVAVYHFTVAGTLSLAARYGGLHAQLIVAAIFTAVAIIALLGLWLTGRHIGKTPEAPAVKQPREMQLAMLIEAVMLGYSLARKREPTP